MSDTALIIALIAATYIAVIYLMARNAPLGFEDSDGWHAGEPEDHAGKRGEV